MGLFKKKKDKSPKGSATMPAAPAVSRPAPTAAPQQPPPAAKQIIKIVGDEKHISHERIDSNGRKVMQTQRVKLTPAEKEQFGMPSSTQNRSPPAMQQAPLEQAYQQQTPAQKTPPPQQKHKQQQKQQQHNNGNIMRTPDTSNDTKTQVTNMSFGDEALATIEITRELVKKFISDIWNRGEIEMIPQVCHPSLRFNGHVGMDRVGHEGFERMVTTVREALTDYHCEIHSMVVESNKAFCRLRFTGKHTGNLLGYAPTGKAVSWMGASEFTCKNGKILKVWELGDVKSLEDQLRDAD
jgi:predicted ester cyclase